MTINAMITGSHFFRPRSEKKSMANMANRMPTAGPRDRASEKLQIHKPPVIKINKMNTMRNFCLSIMSSWLPMDCTKDQVGGKRVRVVVAAQTNIGAPARVLPRFEFLYQCFVVISSWCGMNQKSETEKHGQ